MKAQKKAAGSVRLVGREPLVKRGSNDERRIKPIKLKAERTINLEDEPNPQYSAVVNKLRSYIEPPDLEPEKKDEDNAPFRIPATEQAEIIRMYYRDGQSISWISRQIFRDRTTVKKVIRRSEFARAVEEVTQELYGMGRDALDSFRYTLNTETNGRLAQIFLERIGALPGPKQQVEVTRMSDGEQFTELKKKAAYQLGLVALERNEVYGSTLPPELEDGMESFLAKRGKDKK